MSRGARLSPQKRAMLARLHAARPPVPPTRGAGGQAVVVPVRAGGSARPLFCPPPVSGSAYWCVALAEAVDERRPVYGIEAPGLHAGSPLATIEELAAACVDAIDAYAPPSGPVLVGYSMGGVVAFEMARQLVDRGGGAPLAVLVDSDPPSPKEAGGEAATIALFACDLADATGRPRVAVDAAAIAATDGMERRVRLHAALRQAALVPIEVTPSVVGRRYDVFRAGVRALERYRCRPSRVRIALVSAAESPSAVDEWAAVADVVSSLVVPGDHYSIWSPEHRRAVGDAVESSVRGAEVA